MKMYIKKIVLLCCFCMFLYSCSLSTKVVFTCDAEVYDDTYGYLGHYVEGSTLSYNQDKIWINDELFNVHMNEVNYLP